LDPTTLKPKPQRGRRFPGGIRQVELSGVQVTAQGHLRQPADHCLHRLRVRRVEDRGTHPVYADRYG
jgi:hypothetical protein